jgi:hypothetical protein
VAPGDNDGATADDKPKPTLSPAGFHHPARRHETVENQAHRGSGSPRRALPIVGVVTIIIPDHPGCSNSAHSWLLYSAR